MATPDPLLSSISLANIQAATKVLSQTTDPLLAIQSVSANTLIQLVQQLGQMEAVVNTSRRGYAIPEDDRAEAVMTLLTGTEKIWADHYKAVVSNPFSPASLPLHRFLQSQSTARHNRAVWLLSSFIPQLTQERSTIEVLLLHNGPCHSIAFLRFLPKLQILYLDNTSVTDVAALSHCTKLSELSLRNLQASDFSALTKLSNLTRLVLDGVAEFSQPEVLSHLLTLQELDMRGTRVQQAQAIPFLPALTTLRFGALNAPVSLRGIEKWTSLQNLYITSNEVHDLDCLKALPNLQRLHIDGANLPTNTIIEQQKNLSALCLTNCKLPALDISSLSNLKELDLLQTQTNITGVLPTDMEVLSVDSVDMLTECMPDAVVKARQSNLYDIEFRPSFSLTLGSAFKQ